MGTAQANVPSRLESVSPSPDGAELSEVALQVSDGETDVEILRSVPNQFEVVDEKTANWLVRRIMDSRAYAVRVKEWADSELRRAAREEQTLLFLFGRQIETWARGELDKFKGRRKSLNLPAGCIGFRSTPVRVIVDDEASVIAWARRSLPTAVVTVQKLSKSVLNTHCVQTGELPDDGIHVEPASEKFFIR